MSFSSFKKDQVIFENFRKFVNEEEQEEAEGSGLSWGTKYTAFVTALGQNAKDPKVKAFLAAGVQDKDGNPDDDKFDFQEGVAIPVAKLQPTQNEVDIDKSLSFPLIKTGGKGFVKNNTASGPITVGSPIVTFNGKYVIDGHHRWSQLYACNKDAEIAAVNITLKGIGPLDALKAVQAAIALQTGAVPVNKVEGSNLFTMSGKDIAAWIKSKVPADSIKVIASSEPVVQKMMGGLNEQADLGKVQALLAKYVWSNVATMQKRSPPVGGAGPRDFMPQTDDVNWKEPLEKGVIDIAEPHGKIAAESKGNQTMKITKTRLKEIIKEELKTVMSEQSELQGEGIFDKIKKGWKNFRMSSDERWEEYKQKMEDEFAAKPESEQERLKMGYLNHELDREELVTIPYSIRDWAKTQWDEQEVRRAEREEYRHQQWVKKQAERDAEHAAEMARWKRQQDADDEREAYRKRPRYTGGSLDGEGSPSAPWDE